MFYYIIDILILGFVPEKQVKTRRSFQYSGPESRQSHDLFSVKSLF